LIIFLRIGGKPPELAGLMVNYQVVIDWALKRREGVGVGRREANLSTNAGFIY
jgi:hypothetical protein